MEVSYDMLQISFSASYIYCHVAGDKTALTMERQKMFLSVIIPVYNVEKYLSQCVDSVIAQNLINYEIILVDDGSPDTCPEICDHFAEQYPFISVIHKKNGGLSSARNAGLRRASGEYVIFMDSDDWWNPNISVQRMLDFVHVNPSVDMFQFTSYDYYEGEGYFQRTEHKNLLKIRTDTIAHYYEDLLRNGNLEVSAATKILKRAFLVNNNLYFKKGLLSEDNEWTMRILRKVDKVLIIDEPLYLCRMKREGSITNSLSFKNIYDLLWIVNQSRLYYQRNDDQYRDYELDYCSYLWFSALGLSSELSVKDQKKTRGLFRKTCGVLKYSRSPKMRWARSVYRTFGYSITVIILGLYIQQKDKRFVHRIKIAEEL